MKYPNEEDIAGNIYDKHNSKNPLVKCLMDKFHKDIICLIVRSGAKTAIDLGCGEGYTTAYLQKKSNIGIIGVDKSPEIIAFAKKENPEIDFRVDDIYNLHFSKGYSDIVIATEVLEHLKNPKNALKKIKGVTKKYALISVPREPIWRYLNLIRLKYLCRCGNTPGHIQHWNAEKFRALLEKEFKSVEIIQSTIWLIALCKK